MAQSSRRRSAVAGPHPRTDPPIGAPSALARAPSGSGEGGKPCGSSRPYRFGRRSDCSLGGIWPARLSDDLGDHRLRRCPRSGRRHLSVPCPVTDASQRDDGRASVGPPLVGCRVAYPILGAAKNGRAGGARSLRGLAQSAYNRRELLEKRPFSGCLPIFETLGTRPANPHACVRKLTLCGCAQLNRRRSVSCS
jgi:hypothetical protein